MARRGRNWIGRQTVVFARQIAGKDRRFLLRQIALAFHCFQCQQSGWCSLHVPMYQPLLKIWVAYPDAGVQRVYMHSVQCREDIEDIDP